MAYEVTNPPKLLVAGIGTGPSIWVYVDADAHTDVDADGYFTDGASLGMKANDVMLVVDSDTYTCTVHMLASAVWAKPATLA
jgi:hypothetical protein